MLQALRKRLHNDEEGFTLIELMVVVLIIAILIAIAVPTFLGARQKAQARAAQSNVRNAFTAEKTAFTDNSVYVDAATVQGSEPSLKFDAAAVSATDPKQVFVQLAATTGTVVTNGVVCLSAEGSDGNVYSIRDISTGTNAGTSYAKGTTAPTCNSTVAVGTAPWTTGW